MGGQKVATLALLLCCALRAAVAGRLRDDPKWRSGNWGDVAGVKATRAPSDLQPGQDITVPQSYDIRNISGASYATPVRNQMVPNYCGACWAFATTSALSDRLRLQQSNLGPDVLLSVQQLLNCGEAGNCNSGSTYLAYSFIHKHGIADDTCAPYIAAVQTCDDLNMCKFCNDWDQGCRVVKAYPKVGVSEFGRIVPKSYDDYAAQTGIEGGAKAAMVLGMQKEIAERGPITCAIATDPLFDKYKGGVIMPRPWNHTDHIVAVSGWGVSTEGPKPIKYWVVRNSFGSYWGEFGWFKIQQGVNALGIETSCSWGVPTPPAMV